MKVSVSILRNKDDKEKIIKALNHTHTDFIHLDIIDDTFSLMPSFKLEDISKIKNNIPYDIHIMSKNLDYQINEAIKLKPYMITIQMEHMKKLNKYIDLIKKNNIKVGLAINPKTSLFRIKKYINKIDYILIMSVEAGLGGQKFIPKVIKKIDKLNKIRTNLLIGVDGGINYETAKLVVDKVDIMVVGSYVTLSDSYEDQILKLKHLKNN